MAWVELHQSLPSHRKTLALADALNVEPVVAVGHLTCLWLWALDNAQASGFLMGASPRTIARAAGWQKDPVAFVDALGDAGFVDGSATLHNWEKYGGRLIERRKKDAERKRTDRGLPPELPPDVPQNSNGYQQDIVRSSNASRAPATVHNTTVHNTREKEPPAATQRAPLAGRRRTEVDEEFKQTIEDEFWEAFGSREAVRDCIDDAMGHKALLQRTDQRAYLKTWVRRDAARAQSRPGAPRRQPSSPVKFAPRAALPPCEQCHTFERESQRDDGLCTLCAVKANQAAKGLRTIGGAA